MSTIPSTPTLAEIMAAPVVQAELDAAWADSLPNDPARRHEEGGWVYFSATENRYQVRRAPGGGRAFLDLGDPPLLADYFVVATYHTHPNPASEGWSTGPSRADTESAHLLGVPCIIRAEDGVHSTGPDARRGGLSGNPGFPD
jgi:hypothetical protein